MSSSQSTVLSQFDPKIDEVQWISQIRQTLESELEDDEEIPVCIFNVPKALMATDPNFYIPWEFALGPYHSWRPELYEMQRYKLAAAKRIQKQLKDLKFQNLVDQLMRLDHRIRACYHKYLDINSETLAWLMAVGGSFLLEFLQTYATHEGKVLARISSRMSHLVDHAGMKSAHKAILRDVVVENLSKVQVSQSTHLLDFLYDTIVPKLEDPVPEITQAEGEHNESMQGDENSSADRGYVKQFLDEIWKLLSTLEVSPLRLIKKHLKTTCGVVFSQNKEAVKPENGSSSLEDSISKTPSVQEITIPSVTELIKSGIRFSHTNGSISSISFDAKTVTFYLPIVSLDVNSEATMRNLVAYEASVASGPLVFTRYTELMIGIIDTEEDVKALRARRIILNRLKIDAEVTNLCNGISKSIRLTKVPFIDKVIEDVNKHYGRRWIVKAGNFFNIYVFGSWKILTFLTAICLMVLMSLQAFCSVYSCPRVLPVNSTTT